MFKISTIDSRSQYRMVLEGKLIAPWTKELRSECAKARVDLRGRELVVDIGNLTTISQEGESVLLELMSEGVRFRCCGVFTKQVLRQLARRKRTKDREATR